jgi:hypothetical protein
LIEGVLPPGLIELFGPPNAGKTFVALSLVTAISLAPEWLGHAVLSPGQCVYGVGEGHGRFPRRLHALRTSYGLQDTEPSGVLYLREPLSLLRPDDVTGFVDSVRAALPAGAAPRLVGFDPLAAYMPGGDENSARDMSAVAAALHRVRTELGTNVLVCHHTGWGNTERERGHSALRGAVDVCYSVKLEDGTITLECVKSRDGTLPAPLHLTLRPVADSCVIALADAAPAEPRTVTTLTAKQQRILDALSGIVLDEPVAYSRWKTASGAADTTFDRTVALLVRSGYVLKLGHGRNARYQPPGYLPPPHPHSTPTGVATLTPNTLQPPLGGGGVGVGGGDGQKDGSPPRGLPASMESDEPRF